MLGIRMMRAQKGEEIMALTKGKWSPEEDQKLIAYIKEHDIWNWNEMPKAAGLLRSGKSCRLRWMNYLRPGLKHGKFTKEEEETMLQLHEKLGNRWSSIATKLPGRTDNEIKNYCNTRLRKNLKSCGVKASTKLQEQKTLEIATDRKNSSEPIYSIPPPSASNETDPVTDNLKVEQSSKLQAEGNLQTMPNASPVNEMSGDQDRTMEDSSGYSELSAGDYENLFQQQFSPDYVWGCNGLIPLDGFWIEEFVFPYAWQ